MNITLKDCKQRCLRNCSCVAYASWHGDMLDTRTYVNSGQDFYICVDAEELARWNRNGSIRKRRVVFILISLIAVVLSLMVILFCLIRKRRKVNNRLRRSLTTLDPDSFDFEDSLGFEENKARNRS